MRGRAKKFVGRGAVYLTLRIEALEADHRLMMKALNEIYNWGDAETTAERSMKRMALHAMNRVITRETEK